MSWIDARNRLLGMMVAATCACAPTLQPSPTADASPAKDDTQIVVADATDAEGEADDVADGLNDVSNGLGDLDTWDAEDGGVDTAVMMDATIGSDTDTGDADAVDVLDCSAGFIEGCPCSAKQAISGWACCDYWNSTMALDCAQVGYDDKATFRYEWVADVCECLDLSDPKSCRSPFDPHPGWCPKQ